MISTLLVATALMGAPEGEVTMKFIGKGAVAKVGGYRPVRAPMTKKSEDVKKAPEGLTAAKYGKIRLGTKSWTFILDETEKDPRLFVDTNGDGDLTNDPKATWKSRQLGPNVMFNGSAQVDLGGGKLGGINLYRFDPNDARRASLKNTMLYYSDYGYEVSLKLDEKKFKTFVAGELQKNTSLWIDRDGNRRRSYKLETLYVGKPFNFTGSTYILALTSAGPRLQKAPKELPMKPLPPNLVIGQKAIPFSQVAMDGTKIDFPKSYAGKLVMLDFWATWCGPCIRELPNVKKAYEAYHKEGFDIVGISFDNAIMEAKLKEFTEKRGMPWKHLYEGKGWNTKLGELYDVSGIPFVLLVDGDTGEILATARQLRGPGLTDFIGKQLAKKKSKKKKLE